jgi:hypothetical protein
VGIHVARSGARTVRIDWALVAFSSRTSIVVSICS